MKHQIEPPYIDKNGKLITDPPPKKKSFWEKVAEFFSGMFDGDWDWDDFTPDFDFGDYDDWD